MILCDYLQFMTSAFTFLILSFFFRYDMYTGDNKPAISVTDTQHPDTPGPSPNPSAPPHNLDPGTAVEVLELANGETIW